jgi:hypothetical protein
MRTNYNSPHKRGAAVQACVQHTKRNSSPGGGLKAVTIISLDLARVGKCNAESTWRLTARRMIGGLECLLKSERATQVSRRAQVRILSVSHALLSFKSLKVSLFMPAPLAVVVPGWPAPARLPPPLPPMHSYMA